MTSETLTTIAVVAAAAIVLYLLFGRDKARRIGVGEGGGGRPRRSPLAGSAVRRGEAANALPADVAAEVERLLGDRRTIEAIKVVREETGMGLREAKEFVDDLKETLSRRG